MKERAGTVAVGLVFGYSLSRIGFSSWDEVHAMFTFSSLRLTLAFVVAVVLLAVAWRIVRQIQKPNWAPRLIHPGIVPGSLMFGAGWALSGACPSIALVQIGEGQLGGLFTLLGIVLGNYAYSVVHERYFRWSATGCASD
ncbi:MAG TPA: DUF6691 family protein [Polyangiaceae bacterium]|nr:DUF6691 family protein [Polyangiaceae bacterium]